MHCDRFIYQNPVPTIDALLEDESGKILLGQRRNEPFRGKLNLPGGFVDLGETLEQAVAREVREELGMEPSEYGKLTFANSRVEHHTGRQTIAIVMKGTLKHRDFKPDEEAIAYFWKLPSELKSEDVTTEGEYQAIMQAMA